MYENPDPPQRIVFDAVSSLRVTIHKSLAAGIIRQSKFSIEFPCFIFNFLFNGKGKNVKNKPGKLYDRVDFNPAYFSDDIF